MIALLLCATLALASPSPLPSSSPTATPVPTPTPTQPPNAHVWQGITPGEAAASVRQRRGVPLLKRSLPDGGAIEWYTGPTANAYVIVGEQNGHVQYVRTFPLDPEGTLLGLTDPYGLTPGDDVRKLQARRGEPKEGRRIGPQSAVFMYDAGGGFLWLYESLGLYIHAISLYDSRVKAPTGSAPAGDPHDGLSIGRAYVLHARNEIEGVKFERYYATHRGGCQRGWLIANQTMLSVGAHRYDQLDLQCQDDKSQTSMFFDITAFFGKL